MTLLVSRLRRRLPTLAVVVLLFICWPRVVSATCGSQQTCEACYAADASCIWCGGGGSGSGGSSIGCFEAGAGGACGMGDTCSTVPSSTCSAASTCAECSALSMCNFCGDQKCHAYFSPYGCLAPVSCADAQECIREERCVSEVTQRLLLGAAAAVVFSRSVLFAYL